jgi:uncharacterized protein
VRRRLVLPVVAALVLVLGACSSGSSGKSGSSASSASSASSSPSGGGAVPQGFPGIVALLTDPAGTVHEWCLLLAANDADRERGLMDVDSLGGYDGMVFRFEGETSAAFYMFHTRLPLSIAWYARDGAFVSSTDMPPCTSSTSSECPLYKAKGAYTDAIEVEQGNLGRLGAVTGSKLALAGACTR